MIALRKPLALLMRAGEMSAYASVVVQVNSMDLKPPWKNRMAMMIAGGVAGEKVAQTAMDAAVMMPLTMMTRRNPKRRKVGMIRAFMERSPAKRASRYSPDWKAVSPNVIWNIRGSRKGSTPTATRKALVP
jgi:DMSO/TMAO reductase YedYZ molybdopterin-dependent catalytic subunit